MLLRVAAPRDCSAVGCGCLDVCEVSVVLAMVVRAHSECSREMVVVEEETHANDVTFIWLKTRLDKLPKAQTSQL